MMTAKRIGSVKRRKLVKEAATRRKLVKEVATRSEITKEIVSEFGKHLGISSEGINTMNLAVERMDTGLTVAGAEYEQHPYYSSGIFSGMEGFPEEAARIILEHHERSDGSGFPYNLKDDQIGLLSKIVAICDEYVEVRSHKDKEETLNILSKREGVLNTALLKKFIMFLSDNNESGILSAIN